MTESGADIGAFKSALGSADFDEPARVTVYVSLSKLAEKREAVNGVGRMRREADGGRAEATCRRKAAGLTLQASRSRCEHGGDVGDMYLVGLAHTLSALSLKSCDREHCVRSPELLLETS